MDNRGGKRLGAGRKRSEPSRSIRVPESMVEAVRSLQRIARGNGTAVDLAEIAIAINQSQTDFNGIVGADDILAGIREMEKAVESMDFCETRLLKETELYEFRERARKAMT